VVGLIGIVITIVIGLGVLRDIKKKDFYNW
jgi:hypothetical protein